MTGSVPSARLAAGSLLAGAGVVAAATLVSRVVGLGRWVVFSHSVGATCVGQVYATANQLPNVLYEVAAGGALAAVVVPLVAHHLARGDDRTADRTASALLSWALLVLLPLAVLVALLAQPLAGALLAGEQCAPAAPALGATMLVVFAPQVALYGVGIVLAGVLQAHRRFLAAAVAPLLSSLVVIAAYLGYGALVEPGTGPGSLPAGALALLAGGTTLGVVALSLPLLVPVRRAGVRLRPTLRFPRGSGARAGVLATAGLVGVGAQQICVLATVWLSNRSGDTGVINVYSYVQVAYLLPYGVLAVPLATAAFPRLADPRAGQATLARTLQAVAVVATAAALLLVAVRREIGTVFGALDAGAAGEGGAALAALPGAVAAYAPGLAGFGLAALSTRALYVRGQALRAAGAVAIGWAVAALVPLALLLPAPGTGAGRTLLVLGLASSAGMLLTAVLHLGLLRSAWGSEPLRGLGRAALAGTAGAGAVLAGREAAAALGPQPGPDHPVVAVLVGLTVGALALTAAALATRVLAPATHGELLRRLPRRREVTASPGRGDRDRPGHDGEQDGR